jgi:formate hydrogenlyase subunit 3/multisubunit Na+/H+ antiporter MnhD subunit
MSLLPFLLISIGATAAALFVRGRPWLPVVFGLGGLAASILAAATIRGGERLVIGGSTLATTEYLRLFLVLGSVVGLLLALVGLAGGSRRDAPAVMLGTLAASAVALALPDARIAILASTAGGLLGVLVTIVPSGARTGATIGIREVRAVVVAGTLAVAAAAWIDRPLGDFSVQPLVFGLAYLSFALAVAVRFGVIPFHVWAARLSDAAPEVTLPVLTAWGPAVLALVALAWVDGSVAVLAPELGTERLVVVGIALVTIVLAAIAAWIQDDLEHVLAYSIMADAGVVLVGLAALDPEAWAPTRTWILAFIVARSAFAAWTAAMRVTFWTARVDDLRGWALRSPPLLVTFLLVVLASVGVPGLAVFEAKVDLLELVASGPVLAVLLLTTLLPLTYYGRLLAVGVARPLGGSPAEDWRPRWEPIDVTAATAWLRGLARLNRVPGTLLLALVLSLAAVWTSAGGFGVPDAAAGLAPGFDAGPPIEPDVPVEEDPDPGESGDAGGGSPTG